MEQFQIATIPGDGIGVEVTQATFAVIEAARQKTGGFSLKQDIIHAGAAYYRDTGQDIEADGETARAQQMLSILVQLACRLSAQKIIPKSPRTLG